MHCTRHWAVQCSVPGAHYFLVWLHFLYTSNIGLACHRLIAHTHTHIYITKAHKIIIIILSFRCWWFGLRAEVRSNMLFIIKTFVVLRSSCFHFILFSLFCMLFKYIFYFGIAANALLKCVACAIKQTKAAM